MAISLNQDPLLQAVPIIDGYKVLEPVVLVEKLPEGGMAAVYRGLHLDLKVDVAVKVLKRTSGDGYSPQAVGRFRQEAEQAARLNDPNLVRIYDFPANKLGLLYLVMEYIDGETLESRVQRRGRLTPHETATIAYLSARGLAAAHAENVIHRDIKPPNILLSKKGQVKVTDLGIAKATDSAAMGMTQEVTLLGTPQYMAPELWRGARFASAASDVFAMGATIAFMLSGRHVLDGADTQEIMHRILTQGFPEITQLAPGVPPPLANIVRLCTVANPKERVAVNDLIMLLRELLDAYHGEFQLADATAGTAAQPLQNGRLPSRSDLARIREQLEQIKIPTPIPGTMRVRDDPATVVAQAAAAGRVDIFGLKGAPPTQAFVRPRMRPQKSGGAGKVLAILFVLALLGGGGWFAYQQGWLNGNTQTGDKSGSTTGPSSTRVAPADPPVRPQPNGTTQQTNNGSGNNGNTGNNGTNGGQTKPSNDPGQTVNPGTVKPFVDPGKTNPPVKPVDPPVIPVKPVDPPVKPPPKLSAYEQAKKRISEATDQGNWSEVLGSLREAWNAGEAESKKAEITQIIDQSLMRFRAENRELGLRRTAFPDVSQKVLYVAEEGRSGAAALVAAEALLSIDGKGATRRLRSTDNDKGFATIVTYLERAKAGSHPGARADADDLLLDAQLGQVDFLATNKRWKDLIEWLDELPVVSLRAAAATDPAASLKLTRCVEAVSAQLGAFSQANPEPAKVQAISKDLERALTPYADAGVPVASLLIAQSYISYDAKGNLVMKEGTAEKTVGLLEKARTGKDARVATDATMLLLDTYGSAAQAQAERKAFGEMIATLGKSQKLIAGTSGLQYAKLTAKWQETADRAVTELRKENADLDKRRADFPNLATDLKPLADAGVFSAKLALAETTIGYEGDPPAARAVAKGGDTDFASALRNLGECISSPACAMEIKTVALNLEWDIFASFVRRDAEARPFNSRQVRESLQRLGKCGGMATRQADYAALLDQVLKGDNQDRAALRVSLAEDQLAVQESPKGLRQITQRDPAVLAGVKTMLEGARNSTNMGLKARAYSLLGEIAVLDPSPQSLAEGYVNFKAGYDAEAEKSAKGDPIALMGLAWFYQLPDDKLAPIVAANPVLQEVQRLSVKEREATVQKLYREAAFSGDMYANFLAGEYQYIAFERTPENREQAVRFLEAAKAKGHKQAAVWLARVQAGR